MAKKHLINCLQAAGVTGLSQITSNVLTPTTINGTLFANISNVAGANSQEIYEAANADAVRFYLDISAVAGTTPKIVFTLMERDPATGVFFANNPTSDPIFNATGFTAITTVPLLSTIDPIYADAYQITWAITGTTPSFTCSLVAQFLHRS